MAFKHAMKTHHLSNGAAGLTVAVTVTGIAVGGELSLGGDGLVGIHLS